MRVHEGVYAYELKRLRNQQTQLPVGWEYRIIRVKPEEKLLFIGQRQERAHAEREAQQVIGLLKMKQVA